MWKAATNIYYLSQDEEERYTVGRLHYGDFVHTYPKLFEHICKKRFNFEWFGMIIKSLYTVNTGKKRKNNTLTTDDLDKSLAEFYNAHNMLLRQDYIS